MASSQVTQTEVVRCRGAFHPYLPYAGVVEPRHDGEHPYCADCQQPLTKLTELVWACTNAEYHGSVPTLWVSNRLANQWNGDGLLHKYHDGVAAHLAREAMSDGE